MARLSPETGHTIRDNLFIFKLLTTFNGGGKRLILHIKVHKLQLFTTNTLVFSSLSPHRFTLYLSQKVEPHMRHLPALSIRFSRHPAEIRHARSTPEGDLFLLLRRSTNSASRSKHYCSDGAPILVGTPSSSGRRAKHYCSVAPSPTACLASFL